jgi:DNA ligase D-like protein (predicted 3'-phosphoesterase)
VLSIAPGKHQDVARDPVFVIQKHAARSLHYDFRLEVDGVLKSWAVPKGPSLNPRDKRLAMPVEDHPRAWGRFEGRIPAGTYGAGAVIVWDTGPYRNLSERDGEPVEISEALRRGHAVFELGGSKLRGAWALVRVGDDRQERWLLVKTNDAEADPARDVVADRPKSVLSGRTIEQVVRGGGE